ncbi:MAG: FAD-binding oxidoreductase [Gammaproteobacteria bacterium]
MTATLITDLKQLLPRVATDADALAHYGRDWSRLHQPQPGAVVFPQSIEQVQALVRYANSHGTALVPSGGRTGMSGGALAPAGEVIVSFESMNSILHFDSIEASVCCQPGVITQTLQDFAREHGLFYPVDFGSRGSSQIGGNIATNAGGIKVIRYGLTRNWVSGLKVVTGKGDLLDLNKNLLKNATGYDLRHLFIGSEGTLGFIVEATLRLTRAPIEPRVMLLAVPELDGIMQVFSEFNAKLELNAFECFTDRCLRHVTARGVPAPFNSPTAPYYVLIEFDNISENQLDTALALFEHCSEQGWVSDGVMSESETQARDLWRLREDISESIAPYTPYKNDISVPVAKVADFMRACDDLLQRNYPAFEVLWFGHVGDGNLHVNILKPDELAQAEFVARCQQVNELLFGLLRDFGGSVSAEHGVGLTKKPYLHYTRDATELTYLRALKQVFDPNGIMNPGKIFD